MQNVILAMASIYLLPGTKVNINRTIRASVNKDLFLKHFEKEIWSQVTDNEKSGAHCWAFSTNSFSLYNEMSMDDEVLISEARTGLFNYYGKVLHKQANRGFGDAQWGVNGNTHWDYIFFLGNITPISLNKTETLQELGYQETYKLSGPIRLRDEKFAKMSDILDKSGIGR